MKNGLKITIKKKFNLNTKKLIEQPFKILKKFNIESRPLICGNIGRHPLWIKKYGKQELKNADIVHDYGLYLPNNFNLRNKDIDYISKKFKEVAIPKFFEN